MGTGDDPLQAIAEMTKKQTEAMERAEAQQRRMEIDRARTQDDPVAAAPPYRGYEVVELSPVTQYTAVCLSCGWDSATAMSATGAELRARLHMQRTHPDADPGPLRFTTK